MKQFWKTTLAVIVGVTICTAISSFLLFSVIGSLSLTESKPVMPASGVLKMDFSKFTLKEQSCDLDPIGSFYNEGEIPSIGIYDAVKAIKRAENDNMVKYIYLKTDGNQSDAASLKEIRDALLEFRSNSGKAIISYIENPTTGSYYLSSVADKIYMTPYSGGNSMLNGVNIQTVYLKDLLDRLGVNVQLIRHGKYKSAGEMFTRSESSKENREQYEALVGSLWETISGEIAESRGITTARLNEAIDNLKLCLPADFVSEGLVDELLDRSGMEDKIAMLALEDSYDDVQMVSLEDYIAVAPASAGKGKSIAVIFADGEIIDGSSYDDVAGDRFASIIEQVRKDDNIQAVVLRVNSPGGSVTASEKIKAELDALKEKKPLIASYGCYAASGGYWISNNCDRIFCNPLCITGSIGVFGMVPDLSKLYKDKLHINFMTTSSNAHGDMYSLSRPFDNDEYNYVLRSIEDIYGRFTGMVAEARGLSQERVDEIGQGRVWAGVDALELKLVDDLGGIQDAISYAAAQAGDSELSNWQIKEYPEQLSTVEQIVKSVMDPQQEDFSVLVKKAKECKTAKVQARLPFEMVLQK